MARTESKEEAKGDVYGGESKGEPGPSEAKDEGSGPDRLAAVRAGFSIIHMDMRDGESKEELWCDDSWDGSEVFDVERAARLPARILDCSVVTRGLRFASAEAIEAFRIEQRILLRGVCIEHWTFAFGFVIPGSENSWDNTIVAAPQSARIPASELSGNVVVETVFFDGADAIGRNRVRVFYEP